MFFITFCLLVLSSEEDEKLYSDTVLFTHKSVNYNINDDIENIRRFLI